MRDFAICLLYDIVSRRINLFLRGGKAGFAASKIRKWMKLNLQTKMVSYFLLVLIIASVGFAVTVWEAGNVLDQVNTLKTNDLPRLSANNEIAYNTLGQTASMRAYVLYGNEQYLDEYRRLVQANNKLIDQLINQARTDTAKQLGGELKTLEEQFNNILEKKVLPLLAAGKKDEAMQVLVNEAAPAGKAFGEKTAEVKKYRNTVIDKAMITMVDGASLVKTAALTAAALAIILGITIGYFSARSISRPVAQLAEAVQKVANGDLTERVAINRTDEIGVLANAFNSMVVQLQGLVKQITFNAEQLAASSEELTASAEQSAQAVHQVAGSVTDIAHGAEKQLNAVNETSAVVEQMSASIQQVAATANQVAEYSFKAAEQAQTGDKAVVKAVSQMSHVEQTVNNSATVVVKLGERSKEIGQIVDTISGIAGQTNLLALNAAIEAARAGEQGRGFAVVAEEVRKLAEQSQEAAKQIANLISEIQGDTDKAVVAMQAGTQEVAVGAEVVSAAGQAFKEIVTLVTQVSEQVREISAAIQQMASGSQHIVSSVKSIDELSKTAAGEAQTVSAATEEQSASMEEIASSSQSLAKMAQDLQTAVGRFRV